MIAPTEEVVKGIILNFHPLKYCCCDENGAVVGGYGCHVRTWVVGCALASLLGVEYEQSYIQKCLDITWKKHPLFHFAHKKYPYILLKYPSIKLGIWDVTCDSKGIYVTGTYPRSRNLWKKTIYLDGITNFLSTYFFVCHSVFGLRAVLISMKWP